MPKDYDLRPRLPSLEVGRVYYSPHSRAHIRMVKLEQDSFETIHYKVIENDAGQAWEKVGSLKTFYSGSEFHYGLRKIPELKQRLKYGTSI